jgi:hypothetical protein
MITREMKAALRARGFTDDEIAQITPERAHEILNGNPLTQAQKDALRARGLIDDEIDLLTSEQADQIIRNFTPEAAQKYLNSISGKPTPEPPLKSGEPTAANKLNGGGTPRDPDRAPEQSESVTFLEKLRPGGPWVLTAIVPDGAPITTTAHTASQVEAFVHEYNGKRNLYYSVNPTRTAMNKKAAKTDIAAIEFIPIDLDPRDDETPEQAKARYLKAIEQFTEETGIKFIFGIDSGNGLNGLVRLEPRIELGEPIRNDKGKLEFSPEDQAKIDDAEAVAATLMRRLGAKPGTQNIDRILRLPDTINLPNKKKREEGRVACQTKLLWFNDTSYPLDAFPKEEPNKENGDGRGKEWTRDESGSGYGFRFMRDCHAKGMSYEEACAAILADEGKAGEWANRVDERQFERAWERSKPSPEPDKNAEPQPLMRPLPPPEPFPLDALGDALAGTAQAINDIVQAPIEMCVSGVLASTSFAISAHIDVKLPTGEIKPTSCWFWLIAISGERKTAVDKRAFGAQDQRERQLHARRQVEIKEYEVRHQIWEAQTTAISREFKDPGAAGSEAHQIALEKLGGEPQKPLDSLFTATDFTIEGLEDCLDYGQPLYGIIGAEGGQFIGGHGMTRDTKLRTIAGLCRLWDGEAIKKARSGRAKLLYDRRVGMHLMFQPEVADIAFIDELLTTQGFFSRVLVCRPESLIGTRLHKNPPSEAEPTLQKYQRRILDILEIPYPLVSDRRNELKPRVVSFSAEAEQLFWEFHDECEKAMIDGGEYESIRRFAGKLPEHAARLSTTIAAYKDINLVGLSREDFLRGIRIATYYAHEAKRLFGPPAISSELLPTQELLPPAKRLLDWLLHDWPKPSISARDIYTYGPNSIRNRTSAIALAEVLVEHGWLIPVKTRRRDMKEWRIVREPSK